MGQQKQRKPRKKLRGRQRRQARRQLRRRLRLLSGSARCSVRRRNSSKRGTSRVSTQRKLASVTVADGNSMALHTRHFTSTPRATFVSLRVVCESQSHVYLPGTSVVILPKLMMHDVDLRRHFTLLRIMTTNRWQFR